MKKLTMLVAALLMTIGASAESEVIDGVTWNYSVSDAKASVYYGYAPAIPVATTGKLTIPSTLGGYPVTSIGSYAFSGCTRLTSVTIPSSVTSIGLYAFSGCSGLTSVTIPEGVTSIGSYAFSGCSGLTGVTIPEGMTSMGNYAFRGCSGLTSVTIPSSVTSIGASAFSGCSGLVSMALPFVGLRRGNSGTQDSLFGCIFGASSFEGATATTQYYSFSGHVTYYIPTSLRAVMLTDETKIVYGAFSGCSGLTNVTIPSSVTSIGDYAFYGCSGLTSVTIPSSVTSVGDRAFCDCSGLTSMTIPLGVNEIRSAAFSGCSGLTSVTIPSSVASIWPSAFSDCRGLTSVTIPSSVTSIGSSAFSGCSGLTSVTIPSSVTSIGSSAFSGCSGLTSISLPFVGSRRGNTGTQDSLLGYIFGASSYAGSDETAQYYSSSGHVTYYIPTSLRTVMLTDEIMIGYGAFYGCSGLTSVTIPEGVTNIGTYAFRGCSGLMSVTMPSSVTSIGSYAFSGCSGLTSVTIPEGVTSIGTYAFRGCSGLASVTIPSSVTSIGDYAFSGCSGLTSMSLPFVGSRRGNTGTRDSLFGYIFGTVSYAGSTGRTQRYSSSEYVTYYIPTPLRTVILTDETKIGYGAFCGCSGLTSVTIPESVTSIGSYAFSGCSGLTSVTIPSSVTSIGNDVFDGTMFWNEHADGCVIVDDCLMRYKGECSGPVSIPDGVRLIADSAFSGCSGLTSVTIPSSVTSIGSSAFSGCSGLTSVTIPSNVTSIGSSAFSGCSGLTSVTIPSSVSSIGKNVFSGCEIIRSVVAPGCKCGISFSSVTNLVIADGTTNVESSAFSGCSGLKSVTIPTSVTSIGDSAFSGCSGLTSVTIYEGVTSIGSLAFSGCIGMMSVEVPSSVISMGSSVFSGCSGLMHMTLPFVGSKRGNTGTSDSLFGYIFGSASYSGAVATKQYYSGSSYSTFYIPASLVSVEITDETLIGYGAFYNCSKLKDVTISDGVTDVKNYAFYNCSGLESVAIPEGVMSIGDLAFSGCSTLTAITMPSSVKNIGRDAFVGCEGLGGGVIIRGGSVLCVNGDCPEHVVMPEGVRVIAGGTFRDCYDLVSVTLPSTLEAIGAEAFRGCTSLEYVELPEGLECVGEGAFRDCTWMQEVKFPSSLTNIGKMAFANCSMLDGIECFDGLQTVGEGAFSNCWRMLSVALPVTVDEIGVRAFYNCKSVLGVTVPAHVDTIAHLFPSVYQTLQSVAIAEGESELAARFFSGCKMLQEIALSSVIREIPDSTFEGCSELLWVLAPSELVRIGNRAFYGCGKLTSMELSGKGGSAFSGRGHVNVFEFSDKLTEIGDDAFNGLPKILNIVCPASVKKIGARAFKGVWDDAEIKLPEGLESLGVDAFADCPSIRKVSLPVVVTPVKSAFSAAYSKIEAVKILGLPEVITKDFCRDVAKLAAIQIPASVTSIESYAFSGLSNLAGIDLPSELLTIGEYAFNGDSRLATIALPQSVKSVGYHAFYGCSNVRSVSCSGELAAMSTLFPSAYTLITSASINEGTTQLMSDLMSGCTNLSDVDLPAGITEIGARAFKNCTALAAFGVPNGVVSLGSDVFYGCTGLTSLSLPEGLESIPSGAFQNCRAISSLVIPASVDYIGANAFSGCTALKSVSYLGSCPEFDSACYSGTPSDLSSYVVFGSRGWDGIPTSRTLPEYWPTANARAITYWEPNTFEATFDGNGGTPSSSVVVQTTGMTYVLPEDNPEMLGARFDGWWTQPVNGGRIKSTTKVEVTRAQTFYAHWKYNGYSVRFDANGGIGEMEGQVMTVNTPVELAPNRYLRKGYRFEGWALSPDGEVAFADREKVENLSFEHNAVIPLYAVWAEQPWDASDYLNVSGRAFAFGGDAEWVADDEVSHDGIGSMRSGTIAAADVGKKTTSVMQTTVVGTGSGSFWWKVDCEPADGSDYFDYCAFFVDGTEVAKIAGTEDWGKVDYVVTDEGEHVLKWVFTRDDWDEDESLYENAAWVDEFEWAPTPVTLSFDAGGADGEVPASVTKYAGYEMSLPSPSMLTKDGMVFVGWSDGVSVFRSGDAYTFGSVDAVLCAVWEEKTWTLEEAANITGLTIVTGGDANWTVDLDKNYDGVASIRSGVIGDDQQTWVSIDVEGSGTVAFRTFVTGEFYRGKKCDYLKFEVDGAEEFSSYDANWSNVVVKVSGRGTHTLKWTYLKNASKSAGDDCAWLDEIVWEADAETEVVPTIAELAEVFGEESDVVKGVKDETQLTAFNQFLKDCAIASASDLSAGQKTWAYQSFKLSEIMTAPQFFEEEPVLKFDDIELNDGNLALTVSLHAGAEAITLAKDKLAEKIRVGTSLDAIVETPQIIASPSTDGTSLTFTVAPPEGNKGFVRILIE